MEEVRPAVEQTCRVAADDLVLGQEVRPLAATLGAVQTEEARLPSFFVIGPPRTGSSWLYEVLSAHTHLPSPSKETRFFDVHFERGFKWYAAHYRGVGKMRCKGEIAPTYFASSEARARIAQLVPSARIVCVFRDPVDRIVSLYRLKRAYGLIPWSFEEAIDRDPELVESSKYASILKLWRRSFGTERVMAGIYDDLRADPQAFVDSAVDFIGVHRFRLEKRQYRCVHDSERMTHPRSYYRTRTAALVADWFKARRMDRVVSTFKKSRLTNFVLGGGIPFAKLPTEVLTRLQRRWQPEVEQLEEMLGRDLSAWKLPKAA